MSYKLIIYTLFTSILLNTYGSNIPNDTIFQADFDSPNTSHLVDGAEFASWTQGYNGTTSLCISVSIDNKKGQNTISLPIDLTPYRGYKLLFECIIKAEKVSKPTKSYLGVKFMLHYESKTDGPCWLNESNVYDTFDWKTVKFAKRIATDATGGEIILGLQESSGTAWFDNIKVTVIEKPLPTRPKPLENPPPPFKGHNLHRLRGVMSPQTFNEDDIIELNKWNANVIRWQMTRHWNSVNTDRDLDEYDKWLNSELDELDEVLVACKKYGIKVVVDMHSPPGGRYENKDLAIFNEKKYQDHFVSLWEQIAKRYKGEPAIWGYDLINEPVQNIPSPTGIANYLGTQIRAAEAIRKIDPTIPIFIEASEWDSTYGYKELLPVNISNIIYEVHMYVPHEFTHQAVYNKSEPLTYPGIINGKKWNREQLKEELQPVREFQLAYNVHIYVGEFSAIRWAPGAEEYLADCISIFEEYGWDWTYHAYREWNGWSVEHDENKNNNEKTQQPTKRKTLLLEWFSKNQKVKQ